MYLISSFTNQSSVSFYPLAFLMYNKRDLFERDDDMISVTEYSVEKLVDPFGILTGDRYEYLLDIEVEEDDELYTEGGLSIRLIYVINNENQSIAKYDIIAKATEEVLDFDLEDDEINMILTFCNEHCKEVESN